MSVRHLVTLLICSAALSNVAFAGEIPISGPTEDDLLFEEEEGELEAIGYVKPSLPKNSFYVELLGSGILYSFNYERRVAGPLYFRAGIGVWPSFVGMLAMTPFAVGATFLSGAHHPEFGASILLLHGPGVPPELGLSGVLGYRYQAQDGGLLVRATVTPMHLLSLDPDDQFGLVWGGFSVGHAW